LKYAYGVMSRTYDNAHIYMGDIDKDISLNEMESICRKIQKQYLLSDIFIIKSSHGFNFYSLDKLALDVVKDINSSIKDIDSTFNYLAFYKRGFYVLRTMPKHDKKFIKTVKSIYPSIYVKSNAHRIYFNNVWDLDINNYVNYENNDFDMLERIWLIQFKNNKHGWEIDESN